MSVEKKLVRFAESVEYEWINIDNSLVEVIKVYGDELFCKYKNAYCFIKN